MSRFYSLPAKQNPTITAFISQQPMALQPILRALRQNIFQAAPYVVELMQYRIPFYTYHGRLCYLNPRQGAIELGLCQGAFLSNAQGLLVGDGKQVRHLRVRSWATLNPTGYRYCSKKLCYGMSSVGSVGNLLTMDRLLGNLPIRMATTLQ